MKVLFVVASLNPEWGGPVQVVKHTAELLVKLGADVTIFSPADSFEQEYLVYPDGVDVKLFKRSFLSFLWTGFSFGMIKQLKKDISDFDIIHIHEIWHFPQYIASKFSVKNKIPYVITVHGALSPFALGIKPTKKRIFGKMFEKNILKRASGIQAITKTEVDQIKNFEPDSKIKLIFNGISENLSYSGSEDFELYKLYPKLRSARIILYLGRIDKIKGLDILAESFSVISSDSDNIYLLISGPDFGYEQKFRDLVREKKIHDKVIFTGTISGNLKSEALKLSDIFVLPSYSEAFSVAVLEAIINKLPVIVTHNSNFPEIEKINAGILIDPDSSSLTRALKRILSTSDYKGKIGNRGRDFILKNYTWEKIVLSFLNWYKLVINDGKN